jgi:hypothetical protein
MALTDFKQQKLVVASLSTLMCELDTLSSSHEVIGDVLSSFQQTLDLSVTHLANQ